MQRKTPEVQKAFNLFADMNGQMPFKAVIPAIRSLGYLIDDRFASDYAQGSSIDVEQFKSLLEKAKNVQMKRDKIESSFRVYDPLDTGYISASTFRQILSSGTSPLSSEEIDELFEYAKPNEDGNICYSLMIQDFFDSL